MGCPGSEPVVGRSPSPASEIQGRSVRPAPRPAQDAARHRRRSPLRAGARSGRPEMAVPVADSGRLAAAGRGAAGAGGRARPGRRENCPGIGIRRGRWGKGKARRRSQQAARSGEGAGFKGTRRGGHWQACKRMNLPCRVATPDASDGELAEVLLLSCYATQLDSI